jgi:hypothetical protein
LAVTKEGQEQDRLTIVRFKQFARAAHHYCACEGFAQAWVRLGHHGIARPIDWIFWVPCQAEWLSQCVRQQFNIAKPIARRAGASESCECDQ